MGLIKYLKSFLDLIFPEKYICFICDKYDESISMHICDDCLESFEYVIDGCKICGKPFYELSEICDGCKESNRYFYKATAVFEYNNSIKKAIYKYKYYKRSYMYKAFGELMLNLLKANHLEDIDYIVAVPLHKTKELKRGFNQAYLLAKYISEKTFIPLDKSLLRIKKTVVQNNLKSIQRHNNIKGAFSLKKNNLKDKNILLIDDILTTGATADECSKTLLNGGVKRVYVLTLATTRYN
ncbi:MAG: ComF family protein [Firmicutes bacterium]|nr:ComF family protein [Bacillota bacterium]